MNGLDAQPVAGHSTFYFRQGTVAEGVECKRERKVREVWKVQRAEGSAGGETETGTLVWFGSF